MAKCPEIKAVFISHLPQKLPKLTSFSNKFVDINGISVKVVIGHQYLYIRMHTHIIHVALGDVNICLYIIIGAADIRCDKCHNTIAQAWWQYACITIIINVTNHNTIAQDGGNMHV